MDGTVRLWDPATGQLKRILRGHVGDVNYVTFSPDGRSLATGGDDGTVRLWDLNSDKPPTTLGKHADWVTCVLFTPDGQRLVSGAKDKQVKIWEINTSREQVTLNPGFEIEGMALSSDGRVLVMGGLDNSVELWDLDSRSLTLSFDASSRIQSVAFSHDGRSCGRCRLRPKSEGVGCRKRPAQGDSSWSHRARFECVTFSPDDHALASSADDGTVRLWDLSSNRLRNVYRGHDASQAKGGRLWCTAFSRDGRSLASCGGDSKVNLWDLSTSQDRIPVPVPANAVRSTAFSADGDRITLFALDGTDGLLMVMDSRRGTLLNRRRIHSELPIYDGTLSADGEKLATIERQVVTLRDGRSGLARESREVVRLLLHHPKTNRLSRGSVAFSPNGNILAIMTTMPDLRLWDITRGVQRQFSFEDNLLNSNNSRISIQYTSDKVFAFSEQGMIRIDVKTGESRPPQPMGHREIRCLALADNGRMLATGGNEGTVKLWDAGRLDEEEEATLFGHDGAVTSLAWSSDRSILASRGDDRTVRLWDVATRQELGIIDNAAPDLILQFSPDGSILAGYGGEPLPEIIFWPTSRDERLRN